MRKILQPPQPDLFRSGNVSVLRLGKKGRDQQYTLGLDAVLSEADLNVTNVCTDPFLLGKNDVLCASFLSPMDVIEYLSKVREKPRCRTIIGGQGAYAMAWHAELCDGVALGRCEGVAKVSIFSDDDMRHIVRHSRQPGRVIRRVRHLVEGESAVGCKGRCTFCQYSATQPILIGKDYSANTNKMHNVTEDNWRNTKAKTGRQTTALDGLSEATRKRVRKPVSNKDIVQKLNEILDGINGICVLKVFQIVGYPWETEETVLKDVRELQETLEQVNPSTKSRIMIMFTVTPFSPEPFTAMERERCNIDVKWRDLFLREDVKCVIDKPYLNAFFLPQIANPLTLLKRVAVNRGVPRDQIVALSKSGSIEEGKSIVGNIHEQGAGMYLSEWISIER